jgi:hypothetical protein
MEIELNSRSMVQLDLRVHELASPKHPARARVSDNMTSPGKAKCYTESREINHVSDHPHSNNQPNLLCGCGARSLDVDPRAGEQQRTIR